MSVVTIKQYARIYKSNMLCFIFLSLLGAYLWRTASVLHPHIHCFIKSPVSKHCCALLKTYITNHQNQTIKPKEFIQELKDTFIWIKDITLIVEPNLISITLIPHAPCALLNNTMMLTKDGHTMPKDVFTPNEISSLLPISVGNSLLNDQRALKDIALYIQQLPQEVFNFYTLTWYNHHTIYLTDKTNNTFTIITKHDQILSHNTLYTCLQIKKIIHTQLLKKVTEKWFADIRFGQHIIIKKGDIHGTLVS